jgi:hypothetical protein
MVTCADCGTLHHDDCFRRHAACAASGCGGPDCVPAEAEAYVVARDARECPLFDRLGSPVSLTAPRAAVGPGEGLRDLFLKVAIGGYLAATAGWMAWVLDVWTPLLQDAALHLGFVVGAIGTILHHRSASTLVLNNETARVEVRQRIFSLTGSQPLVSYAALGRICIEASEDQRGDFRHARVWLETLLGKRIALHGPSREDETHVRRNVRRLAQHLGLEVRDLGRRQD